MKSFKKISPFALLMMATALTGCSSEEPVPGENKVGKDSGQYISISLSNLNLPQTRAGKPDWDSLVKSLTAYICEANEDGSDSGVVEALAVPATYPSSWNETIGDGTDIEYNPTTKKYEVLLALGKNLTPGKKYNLYLVANIDVAVKMDLVSATDIKKIQVSYSAMGWSDWSNSSVINDRFMPLNSDEPIEILFEADKEYPRENPYYAGGEKGSANRQSISLTRQLARIDFTSSAPNPNNIFSVNTYEQDEEGNQGDAKPLFDIRFYKMKIENIADKEYLFSTAGSLTNTFISPSSQSFSSQTFTIGGTAGTKPLCYLPEHIPAYSSLTASNNSVTFGNTTYMEFAGLLTAGSACPASLKTAMEAGKDIWYYDDGTFQTIPRVLAEDEAEPVGDSWHKLTYTTVGTGATAISGYAVKYRKAIRHNALADNGTPATDANSATLNANDGRIRAMEYGVLRNHIYEVSIGAVRSLPRPVSDTDLVEDGKETLELQIKIPTTWTYHRLSTEVEVQ